MHPSRRRGFTLPEAMMCVLIAGMAASIFGASFPSAAKAMRRSQHVDLAAEACYAELEAWRGRGYSQIPAGSGTVTLGTASLIRSLPAALPNASGQLVIRRMDVSGSSPNYSYQQSATDTGRVQLEMSVTWAGTGTDRGTVTVATLVFQ